MTQRLDFPVRIPFAEHLGFELWKFADGHAELRLDLAPSQLNSRAMAHGGVLMSLLDVAMAHAAKSPSTGRETEAAPQVAGVVTIEMKTSFMRPAEGALRATGRLLQRTSTLAFTEGSVFDSANRLCAHATGTFKYLRQPAGAPTTHEDHTP